MLRVWAFLLPGCCAVLKKARFLKMEKSSEHDQSASSLPVETDKDRRLKVSTLYMLQDNNGIIK